MMRLDDVVLIDFETRADSSQVDLKVIGGRAYAAHPSTEVLCCVFYAEGEYLEWRMGDPPPPRAPVLCAHNARNFDRFIWARMGWPEPGLWLDSSEMARASGLPGKLSELGERFGFPKDAEGNRFTLALSQPSRAKATLGQLPVITPAVLDRVVAYCRQDVGVMVHMWPYIEDFAELEPEVAEVWHRVNDRGLLFDAPLARALLDADAHAAAEQTGLPIEAIRDDLFRPACERLGVRLPKNVNPGALRKLLEKGTYTGKRGVYTPLAPEARALLEARLDVSGLRHAATFCEWVRAAGGVTPTAQYDDVEPLTRSPIPAVAELATARLALASVASGKLRAGLARVSPDGRMRDNVRYYGAHTGRGAGSGMQWQNHPHPEGLGVDGWSVVEKEIDGVKHPGWDDDRVCLEASAHRLWNQAEISMLLRATCMAPPGRILVAADFSGVEARGNAWAAGDQGALAAFRVEGGDAYKSLACRLFSIDPATFSKKTHFTERDTSKKAELGCGYGMGAPKFKLTAEKGGMIWRPAAECEGPTCADPICGVIERDRQGQAFTHGSQTIVKAWRELHPDIVNFWYALERAAVEAVDGRTCVHVECAIADRLMFDMVGDDLALVLPSGRPVVYRSAYIADGKYGPQVHFVGPKGRASLYGGLLCENAVQAFCRDKLTEAMVLAEAAGLEIILTVHDEIVAEVEEARAEWGYETLCECMKAPCRTGWDEGFPISVEGFIARRYRK